MIFFGFHKLKEVTNEVLFFRPNQRHIRIICKSMRFKVNLPNSAKSAVSCRVDKNITILNKFARWLRGVRTSFIKRYLMVSYAFLT